MRGGDVMSNYNATSWASTATICRGSTISYFRPLDIYSFIDMESIRGVYEDM
jgi:hypothetical protein